MDIKDLETARALYHPTPKVEALVLKLCDLFDKPLPNGVTINGLRFDSCKLKVCGLIVKSIVREKTHCGVLIHWYPNFTISTTTDPFCSAFILRYNSLQKLYREIEKIISSL